MTRSFKTLCAAAGLTAALLAPGLPARAGGLSGTFSGTLIYSALHGERVEGTFSFYIPDDVKPVYGGLYTPTYDHVDVRLSFTVAGRTESFPLSGGTMIGQVQIVPVVGYVLYLSTGASSPGGPSASMTLAGLPPGELVLGASGFEPAVFQAATLDFSNTGVGFYADGTFSGGVRISRLQFDGFPEQVAPAVPEPEAWALLLPGVLGIMLWRRRRRGAAGQAFQQEAMRSFVQTTRTAVRPTLAA